MKASIFPAATTVLIHAGLALGGVIDLTTGSFEVEMSNSAGDASIFYDLVFLDGACLLPAAARREVSRGQPLPESARDALATTATMLFGSAEWTWIPTRPRK